MPALCTLPTGATSARAFHKHLTYSRPFSLYKIFNRHLVLLKAARCRAYTQSGGVGCGWNRRSKESRRQLRNASDLLTALAGRTVAVPSRTTPRFDNLSQAGHTNIVKQHTLTIQRKINWSLCCPVIAGVTWVFGTESSANVKWKRRYCRIPI